MSYKTAFIAKEKHFAHDKTELVMNEMERGISRVKKTTTQRTDTQLMRIPHIKCYICNLRYDDKYLS